MKNVGYGAHCYPETRYDPSAPSDASCANSDRKSLLRATSLVLKQRLHSKQLNPQVDIISRILYRQGQFFNFCKGRAEVGASNEVVDVKEIYLERQLGV